MTASLNSKLDAHRIALQFIADCQQGATPCIVRTLREISAPDARTEAQARAKVAQ